LPDYFTEDDCRQFLGKQVPNFKQSKMMMINVEEIKQSKMIPINVRHDSSKLTSGNVLVQTSDLPTVDKLLAIHGRKIDGYQLSCWLMGHEHLETDDYNNEFDA
jgi:metallophosphoesterase superfamily enzyme